MRGVLVMAECRRGELQDVSLELVTAARGLKEAGCAPLTVAVAAGDADRYAASLTVEGVDEVIAVPTPREHFDAHVAERALGALIDEVSPSVVLLGHAIDALGYGPAVAARRGLGFASDALAVDWGDGGPVVKRGAYGDRLVARVDFPGKDAVLVLVRAGSFEPAGGAGSATVRRLDVAFDEIPTRHVDYREVAAGDVDITKADFLLSIGRGIEDQDSIPQFEELAERMGATLSVSRPLVDAGWVPSARQVGQSGKTVKPKVYIAMGISGAVQHLAGMRKADTIIAVNTDPDAPIFTVAHFGAVADVFDVADGLQRHFG